MSRSSRLHRPVAVIALSAVASLGLISACGSGGDTSSTAEDRSSTTAADAATSTSGPASISSEEFITEANAICATGNAAIEALFADTPPGTEPSAEQQASLKASLLDNVAQQVDDIEALGVPSELESTVEPFLAGARTTIEQARTVSPEEFFSAGNPFATVNELAVAAGLDTCGA